MAQDFGDDMGNALLNFVTRQTENYLRFGRGRERAFDWWQRHYKKEGNTPEQAKAMAEKQSSREQVVVPFGTSEEAAYYAQVCRENGTYAAAYTDKQGNGFLAFAKEDAETVAGYAPEKTYDAPGKDAPTRSDKVSPLRAEDTAIHTQNIRNAAQKAREDCTDFSDFERKMNAQGFGVTETSKGEVMAYEPASLNKDGSVPAYERGRDWPVSAETLKNRYDLDVTHNWFEQNTPKDTGTLPDGDLAMQNARLAQEQTRDEQQMLEPVASDGSMDNDGRTPDPNSGIESHDGADTDSRTAVMDVEQTGSEIRPSDIREEQQYDSESYSLTGEARDMTAAKNQMDTETKAQETTREHGSSLPFNGEDVL